MTLKKCPTCGSNPQTITQEDFLTDSVKWEIRCENWRCGSSTRNAVQGNSRTEAESLWGTNETVTHEQPN